MDLDDPGAAFFEAVRGQGFCIVRLTCSYCGVGRGATDSGIGSGGRIDRLWTASMVKPRKMDFDSDFLKNRYDYELRRREELTGALSMPVGVLTVLGGAMAAMARSFTYRDQLLTWAFGVLLAFAGGAFVLCMTRLARAYHPQKYLYLPLLGALREAREEWRAFYAEAHQGGVDDDFFQHELEKRIIDAADRNTQNNDYRSDQLHLARVALFWVLTLTALLVIPYVVDQVRY